MICLSPALTMTRSTAVAQGAGCRKTAGLERPPGAGATFDCRRTPVPPALACDGVPPWVGRRPTRQDPGRRGARCAVICIPLALALAVASGGLAETIDPADQGRQFAYQEATGWVNAEPLGDGGPGAAISQTMARGWLWSESVGWISLSCENTQSCASVGYGVSHDGVGHLTGFAWGESIGWISFSCAATASCAEVAYGVEIDPASGSLSGFAWAENLGWLSFSCESTSSCGAVPFDVATEVPFPPTLLFSDDFESGSTGAWTWTNP